MTTNKNMPNKTAGVSTRKCYECDGVMRGQYENYRYSECGLGDVILSNVLVFHCSCGAIVPEIPLVSNLHRAIVLDLITKDSLLTGDEIRFLRKMSDMSAKELAGVMGITAIHLSKLENGHKPVGKNSDRLLRLLCFVGILQRDMSEEGLVAKVAAEAKMVPSLNIKSVLRKIREEHSKPKHIRIDPAHLSQFGGSGVVPKIGPGASLIQ